MQDIKLTFIKTSKNRPPSQNTPKIYISKIASAAQPLKPTVSSFPALVFCLFPLTCQRSSTNSCARHNTTPWASHSESTSSTEPTLLYRAVAAPARRRRVPSSSGRGPLALNAEASGTGTRRLFSAFGGYCCCVFVWHDVRVFECAIGRPVLAHCEPIVNVYCILSMKWNGVEYFV